jgi:hypothetical protein
MEDIPSGVDDIDGVSPEDNMDFSVEANPTSKVPPVQDDDATMAESQRPPSNEASPSSLATSRDRRKARRADAQAWFDEFKSKADNEIVSIMHFAMEDFPSPSIAPATSQPSKALLTKLLCPISTTSVPFVVYQT